MDELEDRLRKHLARIGDLEIAQSEETLGEIISSIRRRERRRERIAKIAIVTLTILVIAAVMWWIPR